MQGRWYAAVMRIAQLDERAWTPRATDQGTASLVDDVRVLVAFVPGPEARPPLPPNAAAAVRNRAHAALSAVSTSALAAMLGSGLAARLDATLPLLLAEEPGRDRI